MDQQKTENKLKKHILNAVVTSSLVSFIAPWIVSLATEGIFVQDGFLAIMCGVILGYFVIPSAILGLLAGILGNFIGYSPGHSKTVGFFIGIICPLLVWLILSNS